MATILDLKNVRNVQHRLFVAMCSQFHCNHPLPSFFFLITNLPILSSHRSSSSSFFHLNISISSQLILTSISSFSTSCVPSFGGNCLLEGLMWKREQTWCKSFLRIKHSTCFLITRIPFHQQRLNSLALLDCLKFDEINGFAEKGCQLVHYRFRQIAKCPKLWNQSVLNSQVNFNAWRHSRIRSAARLLKNFSSLTIFFPFWKGPRQMPSNSWWIVHEDLTALFGCVGPQDAFSIQLESACVEGKRKKNSRKTCYKSFSLSFDKIFLSRKALKLLWMKTPPKWK